MRTKPQKWDTTGTNHTFYLKILKNEKRGNIKKKKKETPTVTPKVGKKEKNKRSGREPSPEPSSAPV